ncbi:hypothetical protein ACHAXA_000262 [Cyclostephanos tholiformis]|uniref:Uncharacterized protein n=1 Tax=Cyclostephanos tholiformis TaxID=382380 RepID=A0ABD3SBI1_9STRA
METCGGLGMAKYIDSREATRLKRLKSIKSTICNNMSHNDWQKQQIEKRRKEQLRQRKEESKRKPLGAGIQVDTKISKSDAVSKCGLKLKAAFINKTQDRKMKNIVPPKQVKANEVVAEQTEEGDEERQPNFRSSRRKYSCDPIRHENRSNTVVPGISLSPNLSKLKNPDKTHKKQQKKDSFKPRSNVEEGKENSDSNSMRKDRAAASVDVAVLPTKNTISSIPMSNNKYFKDIESLKREHADAMQMLEELEVSEGRNRRHSGIPNSEQNSSKGSDFSCEIDELDEDIIGQSDDNESRGSGDSNHAKRRDQVADNEDNPLKNSFLDMSHLSTSIVPSSSLDGEEEEDSYDDEGDGNLTPTNNVNDSFIESDISMNDEAVYDHDTLIGEDDESSEL